MFWFLIDFHFANNTWKYITEKQRQGKIKIKEENQQQVQILRLEVHKACCTLRVHLAPDGNWETEFDDLMLVTLDWKVHMVASKLNQTDAIFSLQHVILRKLVYPLVMTMFTKQQCYWIMAPIMIQGLPKVGVICIYPHALVHGPLQYSRLKMPNLYMAQMVAHAHAILWYSPDNDDPTGHLLHATGKAMRLEMQYGSKILMATSDFSG